MHPEPLTITMNAASTINPLVWIIDDDRSCGEALASALISTGKYRSLCFRSVPGALQKPNDDVPSTILLDVQLPEVNGIEALPILKTRFPHVKVIMVTGLDNYETMADSYHAGADAYLVKPVEVVELLEEIGAVLTDHLNASFREFVRILRESNIRPKIGLGKLKLPTPRQCQIISLLKQGKTNKEIANELKMTPDGVHAHLGRIFRRLDAHTRQEVVLRYDTRYDTLYNSRLEHYHKL